MVLAVFQILLIKEQGPFMHDIEPFFKWRGEYVAARDERSPFFQRKYSEFQYTKKVYNYFIHPQWDEFGSNTLYTKILYVDYDEGYAIFEMIGEWNDSLYNDVMFLKREVIDEMIDHRINKFIVICENVLNFHGSDDCYYEEWYEDISDDRGWICFLNTLDHVKDEMQDVRLQHYINFGPDFNGINWRPHKPKVIYKIIDQIINGGMTKQLTY
ncbi:MAG: hypothetical protein MK226_05125 [Saprospiraceae bacterium]|nr:hypothetical protein [Saprospiraceae bacterium]